MPDGTPTSDHPGAAQDWRRALPDELRGSAALADFDDIAALAREHVHLQSLIGRKGLIAPDDDATPEERAAFFTALGRPATPEEYDLADFTPPEDVPWNEDIQTAMLREMHAAGLTDSQARSLLSSFADLQGETYRKAAVAQETGAAHALAGLKDAWGETFEAKLDLAGRAFRATFGDEFDDIAGLALTDGGRVGDHPAFVRAFAALGERMAEPELVGATPGARTPTGELARLDLRLLENDPDFRAALLSKTHPDHRAAIAKRSALTGAVYGRGDDA